MGLALAFSSCKEVQDTRFFAPELSFSEASYQVSSDGAGADIVLSLSRPAPLAFSVGLNFSGSLQEGLQFTVPSHSVDVPVGATQASLHITLVDDEIWDEDSWIDVLVAPGSRYTVNPDKNCSTRVQVKKTLVLPVIGISLVEGSPKMNPYRPKALTLRMSTKKAPTANLDVTLSLEGFTVGKDYLVNGAASDVVVLPAGATSADFTLQLQKKDASGYSKDVPVSVVPVKGVYGASGEGVTLQLNDPVVDLSSVLVFKAQEGEGYQMRQAIKKADGSWNGNLPANVMVSSQGSNYLKSLKNISTTYGYPTVAVGLHILRLADFVPNLRKTSGDAILDYGRNSNTRGFSPVDSLFRFVLDEDSTTQGDLVLNKPRTFTAAVGDYASWKEADWSLESPATGGDVRKSTSPVITSWVTVKLEKLEGRFNLSDPDKTLLFTAWFSCDSPYFMNGIDFDDIGATQENGLWKVDYKLWPR